MSCLSSNRASLSEGSKFVWDMKSCTFRLTSDYFSEMVQDMYIFAVEYYLKNPAYVASDTN